MQNKIYILLILCLASACTSNLTAEIQKAKNKHLNELFTACKNWENQHATIQQAWNNLAQLDTAVSYAKYDSTKYLLKAKADSLIYFSSIKTFLDSTVTEKSSYNNAYFWLDTTTKNHKLLQYTLYPSPFKKDAYILELYRKTQE